MEGSEKPSPGVCLLVPASWGTWGPSSRTYALMDTQPTPVSLPSLGTPLPHPCPINRRGGCRPCWKPPREQRESITPLVLHHKVLPGPTPIMQLSSSPYLSFFGMLATLLPPPPPLLSRLEKPQSRESQWEKVPIVQLLCLSFPILKTHQLTPHNLLCLPDPRQLHQGRIPGLDAGSSRQPWGAPREET